MTCKGITKLGKKCKNKCQGKKKYCYCHHKGAGKRGQGNRYGSRSISSKKRSPSYQSRDLSKSPQYEKICKENREYGDLWNQNCHAKYSMNENEKLQV